MHPECLPSKQQLKDQREETHNQNSDVQSEVFEELHHEDNIYG